MAMYYVITPSGVLKSDSLDKINDKLQSKIEECEMQVIGADRVIKMTETDIDFVRDKKRMSAIAFQNFFMKDTRPTFYFIVQCFIYFIMLVRLFSL